MSWLDIALVILIIIGAYRGYNAGFILEVTTFIAIVLGIFAGFRLMDIMINLLTERFNVNEKVLPFLAFAIVFLAVVIGVSLIGRLLKGLTEKSFFGTLDQALGAVIGILKIAFMISVVVWILESISIIPSTWTEQSVVYPFIAAIAPAMAEWFSAVFPSLREIF